MAFPWEFKDVSMLVLHWMKTGATLNDKGKPPDLDSLHEPWKGTADTRGIALTGSRFMPKRDSTANLTSLFG